MTLWLYVFNDDDFVVVVVCRREKKTTTSANGDCVTGLHTTNGVKWIPEAWRIFFVFLVVGPDAKGKRGVTWHWTDVSSKCESPLAYLYLSISYRKSSMKRAKKNNIPIFIIGHKKPTEVYISHDTIEAHQPFRKKSPVYRVRVGVRPPSNQQDGQFSIVKTRWEEVARI